MPYAPTVLRRDALGRFRPSATLLSLERNAPVEIVVSVSGPYNSGRIVADLTGRVLEAP